MAIFIDASTMDLGQLFWTAFTYGYVLFQASNFISDGSELLLLIPELAGLVGGVVLPVLGAVPDGMMVLFSGLGPIAVAQANLSVGVGALAGSTIMLLTVPWFLSIVGGRVDIDDDTGAPNYKVNYDTLNKGETPSKLTKGWSLTGTGIKYQPSILSTAYMMLFTSLTYLVIQIPSLSVDSMATITVAEIKEEYKYESKYCLVGLIICSIEFCMYLYWQYLSSKPKVELVPDITQPNKITSLMQSNPPAGTVHNNPDVIAEKIAENGIQMFMASFKKQVGADTGSVQVNQSLLSDAAINNSEFGRILQVFFKKYANGYTIDNKISKREFSRMLEDLHLNFKSDTFDAVWAEVDANGSSYIESNEFPKAFLKLAAYPFQNGYEVKLETIKSRLTVESKIATVSEEDDDDEEEDWPEDIKDLSEDEQRKIVLFRAFKGMAIGTLLVLIFSDPMVEVLAEMGKKTGVPAFYISFILAPLASNASELVAAFNYAQKKTSKSITISLATLEGAACMNNTFCLGIFFALIYAQDLCWKFTAETVAILFVEVLMFIFVVLKPVQKLLDGFIVLSLLPISLAIVWVMTNVLGFD